MNEATLKSQIVSALREQPGYVVIRHEDYANSGVPDISVTARGKTTWWEVKYGKPDYETTDIQKLMMGKLAKHGYARYIIFVSWVDRKLTFILNPLQPSDYVGLGQEKFNVDGVVNFIRGVHES